MDRFNHLHYSNTTGYDVFPGIRLFYHNIHAKESSLGICQTASKDFLEIIHCREGRMECKAGDHYYYVSPGDLLITQKIPLTDVMYFPLEHYHGITFILMWIKLRNACLAFWKMFRYSPKE